MPRTLTGRLVLAFAGLALATLLAVGGTLFVVLSRAYADDEQNSLVSISIALAARPNTIATGRIPLDTLFGPRGDIGEEVSVYAVRSGGLDLLAGPDAGLAMPDLPSAAGARTIKGVDRSSHYLYGATVYGTATRNATGVQAVIVAAPDRSAGQALRSLAFAMLALLGVLLLIGVPVAWFLGRSVARPIGRLAHATRGVASGREAAPLPAEGPAEVQELTAHFNQMSRELEETRRQESELLANLRHDLRTPLTSIKGFAEAISDGTVEGEGASSAARTIVAEAQRLERLVAELGVIDRLREGPAALRVERLDATALLEGVCTRFEPQARTAGVSLVVADRGDVAVDADRLAVDRILQNLVDNSLRVATPGGHVWLDAAAWQPAGRAPGVLLRVTDDGPGFPPGSLDHVFERFFRADASRSGSGSGLGLAIVRELARAHGGEAWAENVTPHGARVSVYLPDARTASGQDTPTRH